MITAKNYAAQAESCLVKFHKEGIISGKSDCQEDKEMSLFVAKLINMSVKFALPNNGNILDAGLSTLVGLKVRLPYPNICLEYWDNNVKEKVITVACEQNNEIIVFGASKTSYSKDDLWHIEPLCEILETYFIDGELRSKTKIVAPAILNLYKTTYPDNKDFSRKRISHHGRVVLELLAALSCKNISTVNYQDASPLNTKRIKSGKLPFYETKILVVDCRSVSTIKIGDGNSSHSSPRQHLRRGHIRRIAKGSIWVNSCVVGDPTKGSIGKQYSII